MIVAESGFGTGLNFLTLWQAFDVFVRDNPDVTLQRLHFISFEKYPLKAEDLRRRTSAGQSWLRGRSSCRRNGRRPSAGAIVCCSTAGG